jgi:hypothetical protein
MTHATSNETRLFDLRFNSCRYVLKVGGVDDTLYCGKPKKKGAYCVEHYALCYVKGSALKKIRIK